MPKLKEKNLIRSRDGLKRFSVDMLVLLIPLLMIACYINGLNALWRAVISCASAMLCEYLGRLIFGGPGSLKDLSAAVTGLSLALMLPACCPLWLPAFGAVFAIAVVKLPFGGARKTPFVPSAAGWCFLAVTFPSQMFTYAQINIGVGSAVSGTEGFIPGTSLASMLKVGQSVNLNLFGLSDVLTGKIPGEMGTTCIVALLGVAVYLLFKRPARLVVSAGFLSACSIMALLFPRVLSGRGSSVVLELSAGSLLFVALLILNDPVTSPKAPLPSLLYGVIAGVLCMLLRYFGKYEVSSCFVVLIMNAVWPVVDDYRAIIKKALRSKADRIAVQSQRGANVKATPKAEEATPGINKLSRLVETDDEDTDDTDGAYDGMYDATDRAVSFNYQGSPSRDVDVFHDTDHRDLSYDEDENNDVDYHKYLVPEGGEEDE